MNIVFGAFYAKYETVTGTVGVFIENEKLLSIH
jgi:hypothetical protein